jgi:all-trans-retinol 13,14-reductase
LFAHQSPVEQYDTIVIGAGISGLTLALILAKKGQRVALFEKDRDIAPLIRPYSRKGCECSPGLHTIGWMAEGEIVSSLLGSLGIADGIQRELNENGFGNVMINGNKYHFPKGFDNVQSNLIDYFPDSEAAVKEYIRLIKEINEQTFYCNSEVTADPQTNQFERLQSLTLAEFLRQYRSSPELIALLGNFNYLLMGSKADEVPFLVHAFGLGGYLQSPGFFTPQGIIRLLANFRRELKRFGVTLFLGAEVREILTGNERNVTGVKTVKGDCFYASDVIASFSPKLLHEKLKDHILRPIYRRRLEEAENTFGLYVAFYKLDNDIDIEIENMIDYNDNLDIALGLTLNRSGVNRTLSVFLVETDPHLPEGVEARQKRAQKRLEVLEEEIYNQLPVLNGRLVLLDYLKPWSFERYTNTVNGSAYSIKQTLKSIGFQHRVPVRGLYLVGQAIYPGFLGAMISGFSLAGKLLDSDKLWARIMN